MTDDYVGSGSHLMIKHHQQHFQLPHLDWISQQPQEEDTAALLIQLPSKAPDTEQVFKKYF